MGYEGERGRKKAGAKGRRREKKGSMGLLNSERLYESTVSKDVYEEVTNHWYLPPSLPTP